VSSIQQMFAFVIIRLCYIRNRPSIYKSYIRANGKQFLTVDWLKILSIEFTVKQSS